LVEAFDAGRGYEVAGREGGEGGGVGRGRGEIFWVGSAEAAVYVELFKGFADGWGC
jgi:hypothetical protein